MKRLLWILPVLLLMGCENVPGLDLSKNAARLDTIALIYEEGDFEKTVERLNVYVEDYPKDDLAWTILGHAHRDLDQDDEAKKAYEQALVANPERIEAIVGLGILHRRAGEYDKALAKYERAIELDPNDPLAYSSLVVIALKKYEDKKALDYALKGYNLEPTNPVFAANLAVAYHYNNDEQNRDKYHQIAADLGYEKMDVLSQFYTGEMTIRDE